MPVPVHKAKTGLESRFNTDYWPSLSYSKRNPVELAADGNLKLAVIAILPACFTLSPSVDDRAAIFVKS
jgi:hypothetical protein